MSTYPGSEPTAESLFVAWLSKRETGEAPELEALCAQHPEHASELRRFGKHWQEVERIGASLKVGESLAEKLSTRFGPSVDPKVTLEGEEGAEHFSDAVLARLAGRTPASSRYKLKGEVGHGGMGVVLRVWDEDLRRHLAMKVMLGRDGGVRTEETPGTDARQLARFLEEAQVTGQLDHPGIVPVHELGLDAEGRIYFTMKLVRGQTLKQVFDELAAGAGGWTETRVLGLLLRVCEAMSYAHAKSVIHRDLKPSNVMVGRFGEVYVMDWGLAKILGREDVKDVRVRIDPGPTTVQVRSERQDHAGDSTDSPLYTMDGDVVGTPAYMSPEQALGRVAEMGPPSDVYALGAMLYQLLAGHMPYVPAGTRMHNYAVWQRVQEGPPAPLAEEAPDAPSELVAICEKAMRREASARYPDMSALAADLSAFLEGRVVSAFETGAWAETRKWVKRNKPLAAAYAALVLALMGGLGYSLHLRRLEAGARGEAEVARGEAQSNLEQLGLTSGFLEDVFAAPSPWVEGADVTVVEMLDRAVERLDGFEGAAESRASLQVVLGTTYMGLGQFDEALNLYRAAFETQREVLGPYDPATLETRHAMIGALIKLNLLDEAEPRLAEFAEDCLRELGPDHDLTLLTEFKQASLADLRDRLPEAEQRLRTLIERLRSASPRSDKPLVDALHLLARVLDRQAHFEEAHALHVEGLELLRGMCEADHPEMLEAVNTLGMHYQSRGMFAEAERLARQVLELKQKRLPEGHPFTLIARNNLGVALESLGRWVEAEEQFRAVFRAQQESLGPTHRNTLQTLNNLAWALYKQGKLTEAEQLYREGIAVYTAAGGEPTSSEALMRNNLAQLLRRLERSDEARRLTREAYEIRLEIFGPTNPLTLASLADLAGDLEDQGQFEEALEHRERILEQSLERVGPEHLDTLIHRNNLAWNRLLAGELEQAERILRENLEVERRVLGRDHPSTLLGLENLVIALQRQGKHRELVPVLGELTDGYRAHPEENLGSIVWYLGELGVAHIDLAENGQAEEVLREALDLTLEGFGANHVRTGRALHILGVALVAQGEHAEAEPLLRDALAIRRRNYVPDDEVLLTTVGKLGECLTALEQFEEAEELLLEAQAGFERILPADHAYQAWAVERMVELYEAIGNDEDAAAWRARR